MRGLVLTGCAGFIGLNFLKYFTASKTNITDFDFILSIDKLGYAAKYNIDTYRPICKANDIRLSDYNINELPFPCTIEGVKWTVLNFASESHVDNSIKNPNVLFNENAVITSNLIRWLGGPDNIYHFIQVSTDECYGDIDCKDARFVKSSHFKPTSPLKPSNPYSASKVAQDMYLYSMNHTFKMPVTILRMANQFGPYQHPEKMLPASILRVIKGQPIKVYGTGENIRQWTWAPDTVKSIYSALKDVINHKFVDLRVLHISDERNLFSNNYVVEKLQNILQNKGYAANIEYVEDRKGHDRAYALVSNYNNFASEFEDNLKTLVDWYIERKDIYVK